MIKFNFEAGLSNATEQRTQLTASEKEEMKWTAHNKMKKEGSLNVNLDFMLNRIDPEIGRRLNAHGISKLSIPEQLNSLLTLLENGVDREKEFHTAPLALRPDDPRGTDSAGGTAFKDGSFIILGNLDALIIDQGIKYVLVNDAYYEAIPKLQSAYPEYMFIRADEILKKEIENKKA